MNYYYYNTTTYTPTTYQPYLMLPIPEPPKVHTMHPSAPIGYECGSDRVVDTAIDNDNRDNVVIIDIV
jgi:hypothetical protein